MLLLSVISLIIFVALYFADVLSNINVWVSFILSVILTATPLIICITYLLKTKNLNYLFIGALSILALVFVVFIFLLPEAGIPPLIQF